MTALMLLPGALIVFMGFNAGGYFPATPAVAALVLAQILLVQDHASRRIRSRGWRRPRSSRSPRSGCTRC